MSKMLRAVAVGQMKIALLLLAVAGTVSLLATTSYSADKPAKMKKTVATEKTPDMLHADLAKGKAASASSSQPENPAANAVDGQLDTRWCASGAADQWLQVDLGKPEEVAGCRLVWESDEAIYSFQVEGSADAKSWKVVYDGKQNKKPSPDRKSVV